MINETDIVIPAIELSEPIMLDWFMNRLASENEIKYNIGFLIKPIKIRDHYCILFNTFLLYTYEDDQYTIEYLQSINSYLVDVLDNLLEFDIVYIGPFIE